MNYPTSNGVCLMAKSKPQKMPTKPGKKGC